MKSARPKPAPARAPLPQLRPVELGGSSAGAWALEDYPDLYVFREQPTTGAWEAWAPQGTAARRMLEKHCLAGRCFDTRREALQSLGAILELSQRQRRSENLLVGMAADWNNFEQALAA